MAISLFDTLLSTPDMIAAFDDAALIQAMLDFEAALAGGQADEGLLPRPAARAIASASPWARATAAASAVRRASSSFDA